MSEEIHRQLTWHSNPHELDMGRDKRQMEHDFGTNCISNDHDRLTAPITDLSSAGYQEQSQEGMIWKQKKFSNNSA